MSEERDKDYEAPEVEEVETEDTPAITAAGLDSGTDSDRSLKRSVRGLDGTLILNDRDNQEA